jgi:uncharacterized damage-inducible protein DinB
MNMRDVRMLYEYNSWANTRILGAASRISEDQYLSPATFPHGGLRGTLVHTLFVEWVWRLRWQGTPPDARWEPEDFPTFAGLRMRWLDEEIRLMEFVDGLTDEELPVEFDCVSPEGERHRRAMWESMLHLVNHGTQHRSETAAMLTEKGHSPGDIDLIVFLNERGRGAS